MRLSYYVGLRAIGWLVTNGSEVVQYGTKRVNIAYDNYYEFIAGNPVSKRITRRMKRQARRNNWRYKSRRNNTIKYLQSKGIFSDKKLTNRDLYALRVRALSEPISPEELYLVLMSLQRKRGYKSLRGVSDNDQSEYLQTIEKHETNLKEYRSIAEYLLTLPTAKNVIFTRRSYIDEFERIANAQEFDHDFRVKVYGFLYYQRPLKKPKIGKCPYEKNREVIHYSNPLFQEFRCWRDVMNIVICDQEKNELEISFDFRKKWLDDLMKGTNLTKTRCLKDLGYKRSTGFTWYSGTNIAGNAVTAEFNKLGITAEVYGLWQDLYSATDNIKLEALLAKKYGFSEYQTTELMDLEFTKLGYANLSSKAIRKLLPEMQKGKKLKEAILDIYGVVDLGEVHLRNVILEQHFESVRSLVAKLQKKYTLSEIAFEIDHLFKIGNKGRKELSKSRRAETKWREKNKALFEGKTDYDVLKYKLWEETEGISPYEPTQKISLDKLFSDEYNIDHIVPKSKLFETGFANMVLCRTELNEQKNNIFTGLEFAKKLDVETEYRALVEKMPHKRIFLEMETATIPKNWVSKRQNSDYNTKCFATVGMPKKELAINIPNKLLNKYLNEWNLKTYNEQDARLYLVEAWVLANFRQETVKHFDTLQEHIGGAYDISPTLPLIDFENSPIFMPQVKFVRRTKFGFTPRFQLHGESVFGRRFEFIKNKKGELVKNEYYQIRKKLSSLSEAAILKIVDKAIRELVQARVQQAGSLESAIESMLTDPILFNGKPIYSVAVRENANLIYPLHSTDEKGRTFSRDKFDHKIDFVFPEKKRKIEITLKNKGRDQTATPLMTWIDDLNKNCSRPERKFTLTENSIVRIAGQLYYCIGASDRFKIRAVYQLATDLFSEIRAEDFTKLEKLYINQLGEVVKEEKLLLPINNQLDAYS